MSGTYRGKCKELVETFNVLSTVGKGTFAVPLCLFCFRIWQFQFNMHAFFTAVITFFICVGIREYGNTSQSSHMTCVLLVSIVVICMNLVMHGMPCMVSQETGYSDNLYWLVPMEFVNIFLPFNNQKFSLEHLALYDGNRLLDKNHRKEITGVTETTCIYERTERWNYRETSDVKKRCIAMNVRGTTNLDCHGMHIRCHMKCDLTTAVAVVLTFNALFGETIIPDALDSFAYHFVYGRHRVPVSAIISSMGGISFRLWEASRTGIDIFRLWEASRTGIGIMYRYRHIISTVASHVISSMAVALLITKNVFDLNMLFRWRSHVEIKTSNWFMGDPARFGREYGTERWLSVWTSLWGWTLVVYFVWPLAHILSESLTKWIEDKKIVAQEEKLKAQIEKTHEDIKKTKQREADIKKWAKDDHQSTEIVHAVRVDNRYGLRSNGLNRSNVNAVQDFFR
jgi:hypothetical protein